MALGWANLVTCHALPGPGVLDALKSVAPEGSGCVLVAEMSSKETLATGDYTKGERVGRGWNIMQPSSCNFLSSCSGNGRGPH